MGKYRLTVLCVLVLTASQAPVLAQDQTGNTVYLQGGPYVHFNDRDDFEGVPLVAAIEFDRPSGWFYGLSVFNNSFGEAAVYVGGGRNFRISGGPWRFKLSAGVVCGYDDEHEEDLPIRFGSGCGLGVIPTIGYKKNRIGFDVGLFGKSGLVFLIGTDL